MTDDLDGSRAGRHNRLAKERWGEVRDEERLTCFRAGVEMTYHLVAAFLWSWVTLAALLYDVAGRLVSWLPVGAIGSAGRYVYEQASGWWTNVNEYVARGEWEDLVPPSVESTVKWWLKILPQAFGSGTAYEQLVANIILMFLTAAASIVTGGLSLVIELFWGALAAYALFFRSTPDGDRLHRKAWRSTGDVVFFWQGGDS